MHRPTTRRRFLRRALHGLAGATAGAGLGTAYGFWEASQIRIRRQSVEVARLPDNFVGRTVAVLTDFHHGPYVRLDFIRAAIKRAQALGADGYLCVGDFAHKGTQAAEQLVQCIEAAAELQAPWGAFAVPGNHDMQAQGRAYREAIRSTALTDLSNRAARITVGREALWFAGVDDLWWGKPDLSAALNDVPTGAAVILLAHNPDFAELRPDPRVSLVVSGHTHGGQVYLPVAGAPWMPTRFGDKYRAGLVAGPASPVFVSRGIGEAGVPVRLNCPTEINLLTLLPSS